MRRWLFGLLGWSLLTTFSYAWEPLTHVALAQIALADALDDGKVTIYRVNSQTGQILGKLGDYPVDPDILAALRSHPDQYFAGCLGPDAFPDIVTGQESIHPGDDPILVNGLLGTVTGAHEADQPGEGVDAWLTHIWNHSRTESPAVKAWVLGFMTHCAGDLYAHTFINNYTGGKFSFGTNGIRHVVLESYLGKRGPQPNYTSSLDGVNDFIYQNMVRVDPGSPLSRILIGPAANGSVPYQFSSLRNKLQAEINDYNAMPAAAKAGYDILHPGDIPYKQAWIQDIDDGLKAWPQLSYQLALKLFFNPDGMDTDGARELATDYYNHHMLAMMGFPDAVGAIRAIPQEVIDAIIPEDLQEAFTAFKEDLINAMFHAVGLPSPDDVKAYLKDPATNFNPLLGPNSPHDPGAETITLKDFNQNVLHLTDAGFTTNADGTPKESWTYQTFPPAYNTVTLTKLLFLNRATVNQVIHDLQALQIPLLRPPTTTITQPPLVQSPTPTLTSPIQPNLSGLTSLQSLYPLTTDNVMLGWENSLDDDNQWHRNNGKLIFVTAGVYDMLFMNQIGLNNKLPLAAKIANVRIRRVHAIDGLDLGSAADFYSRITIDGNTVRTPTVMNQDDASPNWLSTISSTANPIHIKIEVYDQDDALSGPDDHCDINPTSARDLDLYYNVATGAITGDATGTAGTEIHSVGAGNDNRAEVWFTISRG
jgi:hypothetical protein